MTPNLRYINQSAPFWDFVASMEDRAGEHPFFSNQAGPSEGPAGAWGWHHRGRGGMAHRGQGPAEGEAPRASSPDTLHEDTPMTTDPEKKRDDAIPDPPEDTPAPGQPGEGWGRRHGRCGGRRGHGFGPRGGHHGPPHHHRGPPPGGFPFGGPHGGFPFGPGGPRGFGFLADLFNPTAANNEDSNDFSPEADVFDTESAFVVHLSLPGAHKEDIGVTYDSEKSELIVAGVVHRPGDEEFLKTLALDERKVGAFERKVRLGTRASPAQVDVEGITAKLENGILVVDVPKLTSDFVEVKKVDIE